MACAWEHRSSFRNNKKEVRVLECRRMSGSRFNTPERTLRGHLRTLRHRLDQDHTAIKWQRLDLNPGSGTEK